MALLVATLVCLLVASLLSMLQTAPALLLPPPHPAPPHHPPPTHPSTPQPSQAAGEAEAALFRLRTLLAHVVTGRHGAHRPGARPSSGAALACLDELAQLLQYLQVGARGPTWGAVVV